MLAVATSGSPGGSLGVSLSPAAAAARLIGEVVLTHGHHFRQAHMVPKPAQGLTAARPTWELLKPHHRQCCALKGVAVRPIKRRMTNWRW